MVYGGYEKKSQKDYNEWLVKAKNRKEWAVMTFDGKNVKIHHFCNESDNITPLFTYNGVCQGFRVQAP